MKAPAQMYWEEAEEVRQGGIEGDCRRKEVLECGWNAAGDGIHSEVVGK